MPKLSLSLLLVLAGSPLVAQVALIRHAPTLNGSVEGSIQQMTAESTTLNGSASVTGDLFVPGTPTVRLNGHPTYGGTLDGTDAATPASHKITLNGNASLGHVVRRTDAVALPTVAAPPQPAGTRNVSLNDSGQSPGNFATLKNLTLNSNVGPIAVPPGTYGDFTANGGSFTLGVAGATTPAIYDFQHLTLNGSSRLDVLGPVVVTLANGMSANGSVGASENPAWLTLNVASGGLTLNGNVSIYGYVTAPSGTVTINGNSQLVGGLISDRLTINGNGLLRLLVPPTANQPPTVALTAPTDGATFTLPLTLTLSATAADPDGSIAKIEFFQGATKLGEATTAPFTFPLPLTSAGSFTYTARAIDNLGATADSTAVTITVTSPNQPPTVVLTAPADGTLLTAPATVTLTATASDPDGSIARVEFHQNATKLGELTAPDTAGGSTFTFSLTSGLAPGTYPFSAVAIDNLNATATSADVTVTVVAPNQPPTVALTAPLDGATFTAPASLTLSATASDPDGSIAKVEFYSGATKLGEAATAPFTHPLTLTQPGSYNYLARATDNTGSATDSAPITITVTEAPAALPFIAGFEPSEGYALGPVNGQKGWIATNPSVVTDADFSSGARSVLVPANEPLLSLSHPFDPHPGESVVFVDLFTLPHAAVSEAASLKFVMLNTAQVAFVRDGPATGRFSVFNGGSWQPTFATVPVDADGYAANWVRLTLRADYATHQWDLYVGGGLAAANLGFADNAQSSLGSFTLTGQAAAHTLLDDFLVAFDNPLFDDADNDGMEDAWETTHGLNPALNDRNADPDADGLTNVQEYVLGTDPNHANTTSDLDGDGLLDSWEQQYFGGLAQSASADLDSDGVSNLTEYLTGRNPTKVELPDTTSAVNLRVYSPQR